MDIFAYLSLLSCTALFCWVTPVPGNLLLQDSKGVWSSLIGGLFDTLTSSPDSLKGNFRIEAFIVRLENLAGKLADGTSCDTVGHCDPVLTALIDCEKPMADFGSPASADFKSYTKLFEIRDTDSSPVEKTIARDICGKSFKKINVRVRVVDHDRVGKDDLISNFRCLVDVTQKPAENMELAEWTAESECEKISAKNDIKLFWRYRFFNIKREDCGVTK